MEKATLIVNEGPGSLKAWNALRLAAALVGEKFQVTIFLMDDGTYVAKVGQNPVPGLSELNLAKKLEELISMGVKVLACGVCINARGMEEKELLAGVPVVSMVDLAKSIKESSRVLVF